MSFKGHQGGDVDYTLGGEVITDTVAHTGRFNHIDFYENTHIDTIVSTNMTGNSLNGESFLHSKCDMVWILFRTCTRSQINR